MFKIRHNLFETNSSSAGRYDDCDDKPNYTHARQKIHICLEWNENTTDDCINEICDAIYNGEIDDSLFYVVSVYYDDSDPKVDDANESEIIITENCTAHISWHGSHYPATRDEPAEFPEPEIDEYDGVSTKKQNYFSKNADIEAIMKIFKEKGWTEIKGISNIYADELDEDEAIDNIRY